MPTGRSTWPTDMCVRHGAIRPEPWSSYPPPYPMAVLFLHHWLYTCRRTMGRANRPVDNGLGGDRDRARRRGASQAPVASHRAVTGLPLTVRSRHSGTAGSIHAPAGRVMQTRTLEIHPVVARSRPFRRDCASYTVGVGTFTHRCTDFPSIVMRACFPCFAGVATMLCRPDGTFTLAPQFGQRIAYTRGTVSTSSAPSARSCPFVDGDPCRSPLLSSDTGDPSRRSSRRVEPVVGQGVGDLRRESDTPHR
jgi:hypothetical protein